MSDRTDGDTTFSDRGARDQDEAEKSLPEILSELFELTKGYAYQETILPLKNIGRYLVFGLAGAVLGSIGVVMLLLALLRALQTHADPELTGNLSWVPYLVVLVIGAGLALLAVSRISKKNK